MKKLIKRWFESDFKGNLAQGRTCQQCMKNETNNVYTMWKSFENNKDFLIALKKVGCLFSGQFN